MEFTVHRTAFLGEGKFFYVVFSLVEWKFFFVNFLSRIFACRSGKNIQDNFFKVSKCGF